MKDNRIKPVIPRDLMRLAATSEFRVLSEKDLEVVTRHYGLGCAQQTFSDIAFDMGIKYAEAMKCWRETLHRLGELWLRQLGEKLRLENTNAATGANRDGAQDSSTRSV